MRGLIFSGIALASIALAGCKLERTDDAQGSTVDAGETTGGVERQVIKQEEPPVIPMAAPAVIQSQPGPEGAQVDLLKVSVTGDVLTVVMRCSSSERVNSENFNLEKVSIIDDATSQRIAVLKDNTGAWMASNVSGNLISTSCESKPSVFWAKFPAPPATSKTVSINFPEVAPFDGVPVAR